MENWQNSTLVFAFFIVTAIPGCAPGQLYLTNPTAPEDSGAADSGQPPEDTGTEHIDGGFTASVDESFVAVYADAAGQAGVYASIRMRWVNTSTDQDVTGVEPGVVDTVQSADNTFLFSFRLDLEEPWDRVVPAGESVERDYLASAMVEPPQSLREVPCGELVEAQVEVHLDGSDDQHIIGAPVELACDL